jgi:hypothetical protein
MVVVAPASKQRTTKQGAQLLAIATIVLLAAASVWIFASSLSSRTESTKTRTSLLKGVRENNQVGVLVLMDLMRLVELLLTPNFGCLHDEQAGDMHLSAKHMLSTGRPYLLYGTAWKKDDTATLVSQALHAGFRFIDTACQPKHYNEPGVGKGWTEAAAALGT